MENIDNPLLSEWNTPFQTPPFHLIKESHYAPAVRSALREAEANIECIATNPDAPTFDNTLLALEGATERLDRILALLLNLNECCTTPKLHQTVMELLPEVTHFENRMQMDRRLFRRVEALHSAAHSLSREQQELVELYFQRFVRHGVALDDDAQRRFAAITEELSTLTEQFNHNALADTNDFTLHLDDPAQLSGLPDTAIAAARDEAARRGLDGWLFTLQAPSYRPFLTYADNRSLREQLWRAYNSRGNRGNRSDNNELIRRITELRLRQAQLLGYDDYASYSLTRTMAQTPEAVSRFLRRLHNACRPFACRDLDEVRSFARSHGADYELQSWDFAYWSERLKQAYYNFDSEAFRPYLPLDSVQHGIFGLYRQLYGLTFLTNSDIDRYHPDIQVFEVRDGQRLMGLLYLDLFPRASKRSGAWMTEFREQRNLDGTDRRPLIQVVCNFTRPTADKPALLSLDELRTFMHEMGHAIHALLSEVHYPSLSGTNVRRDFVEMPSQLMENWCTSKEFLQTFARHYRTGAALPDDLIDKMQRSHRFQAGWRCLRQLNFGLTDMAYHTLHQPLAVSPEAFEQQHTDTLLPNVEGTCFSTSFTHIFSGGYAAGYYGYKWAEVLDADLFERFKEQGLFNRTLAQRLRNEILSRGGSEHPATLFRNFMGRDPDPDALLRRDGFLTAQ